MDPTDGLLDAACDLFDAEKTFLKKNSKDKLTLEERVKLPEFEKVVVKNAKMQEEVENDGEGDDDEGESSPAGVSFFAWFGYRGKDVSAAESKLAAKEEPEIWAARKASNGEEENDEEEEDDDEDDGVEDAEIFVDGESLALSLAQDLWPEALRCYGKLASPIPLSLEPSPLTRE
jgi:hypothetical protein